LGGCGRPRASAGMAVMLPAPLRSESHASEGGQHDRHPSAGSPKSQGAGWLPPAAGKPLRALRTSPQSRERDFSAALCITAVQAPLRPGIRAEPTSPPERSRRKPGCPSAFGDWPSQAATTRSPSPHLRCLVAGSHGVSAAAVLRYAPASRRLYGGKRTLGG